MGDFFLNETFVTHLKRIFANFTTMKRWFSFTMLALAMLMVLAHAVVPHQHIKPNSTEEHLEAHQQANSLIDFLALGFHHEQYDGQQEIYLYGEASSFDADAFDFVAHFALLHFEVLFIHEDTVTPQDFYAEFVSDSPYFDTSTLRGPPVLS